MKPKFTADSHKTPSGSEDRTLFSSRMSPGQVITKRGYSRGPSSSPHMPASPVTVHSTHICRALKGSVCQACRVQGKLPLGSGVVREHGCVYLLPGTYSIPIHTAPAAARTALARGQHTVLPVLKVTVHKNISGSCMRAGKAGPKRGRMAADDRESTQTRVHQVRPSALTTHLGLFPFFFFFLKI